MEVIVMLTHNDVTIPDCLAALDRVLPSGVRHIGFKDIGANLTTLGLLNERIKKAGRTSYMEVVSETPETCLASARTAVDIGVDRLLGGTDVGWTLEILQGSGIAYYPFPGFPIGHPTRLGGTAKDIADHCRRFVAAGAAGVDLLAYRAEEADPLALVRAARSALGTHELIVAGSVNSPARIRALETAGADAFTIGTALFDGSFAPGANGLETQLRHVLSALAAAAAVAQAARGK